MTANPVPKPKLGRKIRERPAGFLLREALAILKACNSHVGASQELPQTVSAKRWVPRLYAYTGARVGEMVQLRREDVERRGRTSLRPSHSKRVQLRTSRSGAWCSIRI